MRHAWTIAAKDLRRRMRDRTAILVAVVLPFGLAWIFSLTLGDVETAGFHATYAVVDADGGGQLPSDFRGVLQSLDFVTLRDARNASTAETLAKDGDIDAAFIFPAGFTRRCSRAEAARSACSAPPTRASRRWWRSRSPARTART